MKRLSAIWAGLGAGVMFFFDPQQGNRRRKMLVDRTGGTFRRTWRRGERAGRAVSAEAYGVTQKVRHRQEEEKDLDDVTLARKVESEIFRDADAPKGQVDVNVENGIVFLRGEVERPEQIEQLGAATGHEDEAEAEVERIRSSIEAIAASAPAFDEPPTYYHELDDTYFTVTSDTFIGQVYELAGLRNIADKADKAGTGYPQLSAEYIVSADPDFIFLADSECCGQTPERVARRPGWDGITAVRRDAVFDVGDDVSSRWGPRVVDFLQTVVDSLRSVDSPG